MAFWLCKGLTSITIPSSVTSIGESAFRDCDRLTEVNFNATSCKTMGVSDKPVFSGCTSLTTINIGSNVQNIPDYAFYSCSRLVSVTIPNSILSIGNSAFSGCSGLTSITIPSSVTNIGEKAFSGCDRIQFIYSKNTVPPTCASTNTFASDIYKYAYLYVPTKSVPQYKTAYEWRNFTNIMGQDDEGESPYQMEVVLKNGTTTTYDLDDIKEVNIINR